MGVRTVRPVTRTPTRLTMALLVAAVAVLGTGCRIQQADAAATQPPANIAVPANRSTGDRTHARPVSGSAATVLETLPVKGRAPKTGYSRNQFGSAWTDANGDLWGHNSLETRQDILSRDLTDVTCKTLRPAVPPCVVATGVLHDPYTASTINFVRGDKTSSLVQVDHVSSLSDSWQKGAQQLSRAERVNLANDPLNLIATDGSVNQSKGDGDAATWLVPNRAFRCTYVARQIAVKVRYHLWVTQAEHDAMERVLARCPGERLPTTADAARRTVIQ